MTCTKRTCLMCSFQQRAHDFSPCLRYRWTFWILSAVKNVFSVYTTFRPDALRTPTKLWLHWHRVVLDNRHVLSLLYTCSFPAGTVLASVCIFVHGASGLAYSALRSVRGASTKIRGHKTDLCCMSIRSVKWQKTLLLWKNLIGRNHFQKIGVDIKINFEEVGREDAEWIGDSGGLLCSQ